MNRKSVTPEIYFMAQNNNQEKRFISRLISACVILTGLNLEQIDQHNTTLQELRDISLKNLRKEKVEQTSVTGTSEEDKVWHLTKTDKNQYKDFYLINDNNS